MHAIPLGIFKDIIMIWLGIKRMPLHSDATTKPEASEASTSKIETSKAKASSEEVQKPTTSKAESSKVKTRVATIERNSSSFSTKKN